MITPTGGVGPYTITPAQTGLAAGNHTFTVTDANGCSITVPITITQPTTLTATAAVTNILCNGASTGSVVITPTGGVGPYTITPAQTGLAAGNYVFTVTDANGCSITVPITITQPSTLTATTAVTNILCNGASTGSVVITPTGGVGPYTISPAQTGLAAGNYVFTVTDANGCSITVPATITQPSTLTATTAVTNILCNGASTGSVVITPTGGVGPYTITPARTGLAAGNYVFTVTDANGCSITVPATITEPADLTATTVVTNILCNGAATGSVVITPTGGAGPYTITPAQTGLAAGNYVFTVTDANGCSITVPVAITEPANLTANTAITNTFCGQANGSVVITPSGGLAPYTITPAQTNLIAGNYNFTVTDANGCTLIVPVTITQPSALAASATVTNVLCNGASTGSVVITPSGGVGPYTITPAQTGLAAGNHVFTVTDANGCAVNVSVTISEPAALTATTTVTNILCNGASTGSVVITPTGGVAPYVITPAQTNLVVGNYNFTVTDANGCSITVPVTITQPTTLTATAAVTNILCNGASTGSVVITPTGGVGPYTISPAQTGLAAGNHTFTVTDANGCSITVPITITQPSTLTATTAVTNILCNGASTGSVVITPTGGVGPYTITPAQTGLAAGNHTFTVTDANGCSITVPITITQPTTLTATAAVTNILCNGASTGSVVITPTGGVGPYTITPAQTGLAAGNYVFTVTDANGCSITVPITITQPSTLTATAAVTNILCNGASTGSVVITPTGGVGSYTISPAQTGLAAGNHTFTVTDANGCSITVPITITQPSTLTATTAVTNILCNGASTGSVVITPTGGVGPYTITPAQTGLAAGNHTFTVTDANGCSITVPITITQPTTLTATAAVTNILCNGASTGSVVITPTGGVGPYTITPAQTGLAAGNYVFTVTDANGCSITVPITITQPSTLTATTAVTNILCNGASTGSVVITPTGGVGPYTISPAQTGLAAGNYVFTVTDANGCSITVPATITQPSTLTATTAVTNILCNGASTGSVVITPTGGVGPYTITPAQTGLAAGNYVFTVTDANGCSITVPATITEPADLTATTVVTNILCNGAATGSVVITPTGGAGPYTITPAQTGLAAGNYVFTVTDANGCSITVPVAITEPANLTANTAITNTFCGQANGSVVITPSGGLAPYTITPAQTNLIAGNYNFTVTDANGCTLIVPVTITQPSALAASATVTNVLCNGASTGSVVITPSGGVGPYTITPAQTGLAAGNHVFTVTDANGCAVNVSVTISEPAALTATTTVTNILCNGASTGSVVITPSGGVGPYTISPVQTGLSAGNYVFTVTDANGCSITVPATITEPADLTATAAVTNILCNGTSTGSVVITPTGGVGPYTITPMQTGLAAGNYVFTVTDANGCSITVPATITQPTTLTATAAVTNILCNGASTGSVVITPTGGVGPYTITPAQTGLAAGNYVFTVTDANGCSITVPATITEPADLTATAAVTNILCNGTSTGSVVITPSGGVGPYTISPAQTGLAAGIYVFTVTDANGCSITVPATITEPADLTATAAVTNILCNGASAGSVVITPTGGVGPYTITPAQTGLAAGNYVFTVTDANGCSITVPATITEPADLTATAAVTNILCNGASTGSLVITPSGGVGPYTITPAQTNLVAGNYNFTVTDANGCSIIVPVTITQPNTLTATTAVTNILCNGASTGSVVITPTGGVGPYTITPTQTGLAAGNYVFTVTDANGCSITVPATITEPADLTATAAVTNILCNGASTGSVVITPTGGVGPYMITPAQTGLAAGNYVFTVTDANGCSIAVPVTITQPTTLTATATVTNILCNGASTGSVVITPTGGVGPYTITPAQTGLAAGNYVFTVTDANGCSITVPVAITEPANLTANTAITNTFCGQANGSVVITPSGGLAPYTITPAQTNLIAGNYNFTVTDANGCTLIVPVTITQPSALAASATVTNVLCNGASTGSVVITPSGGVGPYTITPAQTGLAAGNYVFTVTDANGCSITVPATITQPSTLTATTAVTNVLCNGASTGSVVITPTGGVGPYTITPAQTNLVAGNYNFTVTDANGCTLIVPVSITQPSALTASAAVTNILCNGTSTGSVVITPAGGVGPYTITPAQTGLSAGNYNFTVTDANGCTLNVPVTISQPSALSATSAITNVLCNGALTGSVVITPSGGVGPYTITPAQTGLAAGNYVFTVTDANGCSITVPATITEPADLTATAAVTNVLCNGASTGSVVITPAGGVGPYTITPAQTNLVAGNYNFTVTDANGCSITVPVTITQPTTLTATAAVTNILCNGASTGSVVITPTGGVGPYTITPSRTGLAAGNYVFTVTDANGCSITVPVTISEPADLTATAAVTNILCNGASTGSVIISPTGGVAPYTISPAQTGLAAGNHIFTVTDAHGCSITLPVIITEPSILTATTQVTDAFCGAANGSVIITPSGGVGPYTISPAQTGLLAGNYNFTVTDANGCTINVPVTISQPSALTASASVSDVLCNGAATGSVVITPNGGVGPYSITPAQTGLTAGNHMFTVTDAIGCSITIPVIISEPSGLTATTAITDILCYGTSTGSVVITPSGGVAPYIIAPAQTGLAAGVHVFTVTDANGCSFTVPVTITQPAILTATTAVTNILCNGASTGSVVITPAGGVAPYTIFPAQTGLAAGNHMFTVTDANGCTVEVPVTITEEPAIIPTEFTASNCLNYTLPWGAVVTASGDYVHTYQTVNGCDSVVTAHVTINNGTASEFTDEICLSYTLPWGTVVNISGDYVHTYQTINGCDSVVTAHVTINNAVASEFTAENCFSYTLPWGTVVNASGDYVYTYQTVNGCDSVVTAHIIINNATASEFTDGACLGYSLPWGTVVNASGDYVHTYQTVNGCDSVVTAHITIYQAASSEFTAENCLSYTLPWGAVVTESGEYLHTYQTIYGCDSVVTAHISINQTASSEFTAENCLSYTLPWGIVVNVSGDYEHTYQTVKGCDSVVTAHIIISSPTVSATEQTVCASSLPYNWNGTEYSAAGTYTFNTVGANGCDSVATLILTVNSQTTSTTEQTVCASALPYTWNGTEYSAAGTYTFNTVGANGCDSVATLILTVNSQTTSTTEQTVCASALPFTWNGTEYSAAGTYTFNTVGANGCDSIATLILTVNSQTTSTTEQAVCASALPFTWNGIEYTDAGTYTFNTVGANGCDSVATLILTVNSQTTSITEQTVCASALPYTWNGIDYSAAGTYTFNTVGANGCDSVATLILTLNSQTASTTEQTVCASALPFTWNGTEYTAAGTYTFNTTGANGCDSIATLILSINDVVTSTTDQTVCASALPFTWNGTEYSAAGTYTFNTTGANGCDSVATLILTVNSQTTSTTEQTVCASALPYTWNGTTYTTAGTYTFNTVGASGCDSVATLILTVNSQTTSTTEQTVCSSALPITWNGIEYSAAGTYTFNTVGANGCDSVATLILTVNNQTTSTTEQTVCASALPYTWNGTEYTAAGTYTFNTVGANGCDSIATLILSINDVVTSTTEQTVCASALPFTWNGTEYSAAGTYTFNTTATNGCDSVATLILTVNSQTTSTTEQTVCASALPYTWNGTEYTAAGTYTFNTVGANGCDSVATLILTVNSQTTSTTEQTVCASALPFTWNGAAYTTAGTYTFNTTGVNGCDSVATLILTISDVVTSTTEQTVCASALPFVWNGTAYTTAGTYTFNTTGVNGCDSVATLILTVNSQTTSTTEQTVCASALPYTWNATKYSAAGAYTFNTVGVNGCDSVATLILTISDVVTSTTGQTVCASALPFTWNGAAYTTAGTYTFNTTGVNGCDSVATLILTVNNQTTSTTEQTVCASALPYTWNGTEYTAAGTYTFNTVGANGCDSVATLILTVNSQTTSITEQTVCASALPYTWNGIEYTAAGTYTFNTVGANGCDSVATLILTVNSQTTSTTEQTVCASDLPFAWNGAAYTTAGTYTFNTVGANGCDSVATLILTVNNQTTSTTEQTVCASALPITWNGTEYTAAGTYTFNTTGANGCDSIATLILSINDVVTSTTEQTVCASALPFTWNGTEYSAAGTYTFNTTATNGCDSVATLILTVNSQTTSTTEQTVCASALPYTWNGTEYTAAGTYTFNTVGANGCDSVATLILTVNSQTTSTTEQTVCASALPFTWNGTEYTAAGTYTFNTVGANGCDSVATLILTVNSQTTSTTEQTVCASALPYTWNGTEYTAAGTYIYNTTGASGCDSVATLILTVNSQTTSTTEQTVCSSALPITWNGIEYSAAGTYTFNTVGANGCDSVATLILTVNSQTTSTTEQTVCASALPFIWNGTDYSAAGTYTFNTVGANGCDSVATLILTVNSQTTSTTEQTVCASALPYTWNGTEYSAAGTYTFNTVGANGCDSVATLILTVNSQTTSTTEQTVCASALPITWNGTEYSAAGTYTFNTVGTSGCDSIATLILSINDVVTSTTEQTVCASALPFTWNGTEYSAAGTYTFNTTATNGCDSVATLILTVNSQTTSTTEQTVCASALPYTWNGTEYTAAGTYTFNTVGANGCDSVATLILTVNSQTTSTTEQTVCASALPFTWNGAAYTTAGTYTFNTTGVNGCDSVATLILTISDVVTSTTEQTVCASALPFVWNGTAYTTAGTYTFNTTGVNGCDSVATLILTVNSQTTSTTEQTVCASALPYTWNATKYSAAGAYTFNTVGVNGCDSVATLILTISDVVTSTTGQTVCASALPFTWNGAAYTTAGTYTFNTTGVNGCDSVATLILTVNNQTTSTTEQTVCASALPYTWNGTEYTAAGTYTFNTVGANGCDSVATLILTVNSQTTSTTEQAVCASALPFTWNGIEYTVAGNYIYNTTGANGCDSVATLILTVNSQTTSTTEQTVCASALPFTWNGIEYTAAGTYTFNTTGAHGCDSVATLILTVNSQTTSTTEQTVCASALPFTWNGTEYSAAGTYTFNTTGANGCDSVATLILTVNSQTTSTTEQTVCASALPYTWNGTEYTAAGTYTFNTVGANGCDSVATLILTVNSQTTSTTEQTVCASALPYTWNGTEYTAAGTYIYNTTGASGCDSVATLILTVNSQTTSTTEQTVCASALPIIWNGIEYSAAGTYTFNTVGANGCDSVATLILTVNSQTTSITEQTVCASALPYTWNGIEYTAAGTYTFNTVGANGCDSVATLILTVNSQTTSTTEQTVCASDLPFAWNGAAYTTAGTYTFNTVGANGCDSVATLILTVNNQTTSTTEQTVCASALPITWNGTEYTAAGTYTFNTTGANGCDSIATLILSINDVVTSTTEQTVCASALPFTWNGTEYSAAGTYTFNTTATNGCDSVATLILTVNSQTTSTTEQTVCASALPYTWNGTEYTAAGTYTFNTVGANGCDSVATLNLTVNSQTTSTTEQTVCASALPFTWNGTEYSAVGTYTFNTVGANGCDSVATLILTISDVVTSTTEQTVCASTLPFTWNGSTYTTAGTYTFNTTGANGCDSVATLILTISDVVTSTTEQTVCASALPIIWNGIEYSVAGTYIYNTTGANGCDSVATLILTVNSQTTSTTEQTVCASALPIIWNGIEYSVAGNYIYNTTGANGCDSVATLILTVNSQTTSTTEQTVCASALPFTWNGTEYSAAGTYTFNTVGANGCDSVATLILTVNSQTTSTTEQAVCASALPFTWNGTEYSAAGTYTFNTVGTSGCDSIATLILSINDVVTSTTEQTVCASALPFNWNGIDYSAAGTYTYNTTGVNGCDSVATLILTVNSQTTSTTEQTVCASALPYTWNGTEYTAAGTYTFNTTSTNGCDSVATLVLTVNSQTTSTTEQTVCASALPITWNGTEYTAAGTYTFNTTSTNGCDSVATLILTVNSQTTSTTEQTVCASALPITWNGIEYTAAGTYTFNTTGANGCDSIATLILSINDVVTSTTEQTVCASALPFTWNGTEYTAAGTYTFNTTGANGCDSVATLILSINDVVTSTTDQTVCASALPFTWNGTEYSAAGTYTFNTVGANGCDSVATLILTLNSQTTSITEQTVCASALPYTWNGIDYSAAGTYTFNTVGTSGCDSIATLILSINDVVTSTTEQTVCASALPFTWNVSTYTTAGTYTFNTTGVNGCDSVATLILTVNNQTTSTTEQTVCASALPFAWNGTAYTTAGTYTFNTTGVNGCDSVATLILTISDVVTSTTEQTVCASALPFTWNGIEYSVAGTYTYTTIGANGCDSVATLILSINDVLTSATEQTVCVSALPFIWNGTEYTTAGTYTFNTTSINGCDSVATLILRINDVVTSTTEQTVCASALPFTWNGTDYSAAGTYTFNTVGANGCDSVATLILSINDVVTSATEQTVCASALPFTWNGIDYSAAGTYTYNTTGVNGCDSVATLILRINHVVTSTIEQTVCASALPFTWNGTDYSAAGTYIFNTTATNGCDSVAKLILQILNATSSSSTISVNPSALPMQWNGITITAAGTYNFISTGVNGCDSTAALIVKINDAVSSITEASVCSTRLPYMWNGKSYTAAGTYSFQTLSTSGVDSIATLILRVNEPTTSVTNVAVCPSAMNYVWNGISYSSAGSYTFTTTGVNGCDSIATLILTVNQVATSVSEQTICESALPFVWNGNTYTTAGNFEYKTTAANGCDSIAKLILNVTKQVKSTTNITVCTSSLPYYWNGKSYNAAGTYTYTSVSSTGCDSLATLILNVNALTVVTISANAAISCENTVVTLQANSSSAGLSYTWFKNEIIVPGANTASLTINSAGRYKVVVVNASGCQSEDSTIVVNQVSEVSVNAQATSITCTNNEAEITVDVTNGRAPFRYSINGGTTYQNDKQFRVKAAGMYNILVKDANGCTTETAVEVKQLTSTVVVEASTSGVACGESNGTLTVNAYNGTAPYTYSFDGGPFVSTNIFKDVPAGVHTLVVKDAAGCTSTANATIEEGLPVPVLVINDPAPVCMPQQVDITNSGIATVSRTGLSFSYWKDSAATVPLTNPDAIAQSGTYYIKAINTQGCHVIKPVAVVIGTAPTLKVTSPAPICMPGAADLTSTQVTGVVTGLTLTYWMDQSASQVMTNPAAAAAGTYYIRATNAAGCAVIQPVNVTASPLPAAKMSAPDSVCKGAVTPLKIQFTGTAPWSITYKEGNNVKVINSINSSSYTLMVAPSTTTTYELMRVSDKNCTNSAPGVTETIYVKAGLSGQRLPDVMAYKNIPVMLKARNLGSQYNYQWTPPSGLSSAFIINPVFEDDMGNEYQITMRSETGCNLVDTLRVRMMTEPDPRLAPQLHVPRGWTPNGDGRNDVLKPYTLNIVEIRYFRVYNRWGQLMYETKDLERGWDGIYKGKRQPNDAYTWMVEGVGIDGTIIRKTGNSALLQ